MTSAISKRLRRSATVARARLEDALLGLRELPVGVDRAPIAAPIERGIAGGSTLLTLEVDHDRFFPVLDDVLRAAAEATAKLDPVRGSPSAERAIDLLAAVDRGLRAVREAAIDALVADANRRLRAAPPPASEARPEPFRASVGAPSLHAVLRAPPRVLVDLRPPPSVDAIDDEEDVIDEPAEAPPPVAATAEGALLVAHARALARECLSDIGNLSGLRVPLEGAPWTNAEAFERRMLADLDALLALAAEPSGLPDAFNVFEEVQRYARDAPTVDPSRELARALTFACTRGESAIAAVVLTMKQAHPETLDAYRDALSLARHPATATILRERLLVDADPRRAALAIEVLRFLREARFADVIPLSAHPDARVRRAAIRALAFVPEREAAADVLLDAIDEEEEPRILLDAAESLLRLGRVEGLAWARARVDAGDVDKVPELRLDFLRLLALAGGENDLARAAALFEVGPRDATLAGLFGHAAMVPRLIDTLAAANSIRRSTGPWAHPVEVACAEALWRITGAGLRDAPREVDDYDFAEAPTIFAETWNAWWDPRAQDLATRGKLRWGEPWSPRVTVAELGAPSAIDLRDDLALELSMVAGDAGLEPSDWVARQRAVLATASTSAAVRASPHPAGTFPEAWLGRG